MRRHPILYGAVLGGQHHLAGLQTDAVTAFYAFQDFLSLFAVLGYDLRELFEQGLGHGVGNQPMVE